MIEKYSIATIFRHKASGKLYEIEPDGIGETNHSILGKRYVYKLKGRFSGEVYHNEIGPEENRPYEVAGHILDFDEDSLER
ncbi:MAG: hypothetical protein JST51_01665 [Armatimonadetes bacterium]|nr:hypothetical protein [Armatimonadota bacterium]